MRKKNQLEESVTKKKYWIKEITFQQNVNDKISFNIFELFDESSKYIK